MQARNIFNQGLDIACAVSMPVTLVTGSAVAFAIAPGTNIVFALAVYGVLAGPYEVLSFETLEAAYECGISNVLTGFFASSIVAGVSYTALKHQQGFFQRPQVIQNNQRELDDQPYFLDRPLFQN